jgi:phytoene synthase
MIKKDLLKRARLITRQYGRGFYRSSFLFTKKVREATWILYAFVRLPDEIVDSQKDKQTALLELNKWTSDWKSVIENNPNIDVDPLLLAAKELFDFYKIPYKYSHDFLFSMHQDLIKSRYETYKELEDYMYGSAAVIGLMMSHIIGFRDGALPFAKALGEAFQLINFIRDAKEDYDVRGRVYLPKEDMDHFGVTENHIAKGVVDDAWRAFIKYESDKAQELLSKGILGVNFLNPKGRSAIYAAALIYGKILREFEKTNYDTLSKRIVISPLQKTMLLFKAVWNKNQ